MLLYSPIMLQFVSVIAVLFRVVEHCLEFLYCLFALVSRLED